MKRNERNNGRTKRNERTMGMRETIGGQKRE
jgi:hypothetical protein